MIIERARQLALRSPARVVFPDALDVRVLKAAHYLQQQGLARPILVASPFALRQFALSHRVPMDGIQVIDPHSNLSMREAFAERWLARAGEKTPPDALEKLNDPLMFAAAMVSAGKADVCIAGNLSSTANVLRAGLRIIGLLLPRKEKGRLLCVASCHIRATCFRFKVSMSIMTQCLIGSSC